MIEIKGDLLEEVKPAFEKTIDRLIVEASKRIVDIGPLVSEVRRLAGLVGRSEDIDEVLHKYLVVGNEEVLEDLFDMVRLKDLITPSISTFLIPEVVGDIGVPLFLPEDTIPEGNINLVTGSPLEKTRSINTNRSRSKPSASKPSKKSVHKSDADRRYRGIKTKVEYRGVTYVKNNAADKRYRVRLMLKGVEHEIGLFHAALEAAYAYDEFKYGRTKSLKGLNFPERIEMRLKKKNYNG